MKTLAIFLALVLLLGTISINGIFPMPSVIAQEEEESGNGEQETETAETTTEIETPESSQQQALQVTANDIQRGNTQTIKIQSDSPGDIIGILTYPSGHQAFFQGTTDESGALDYSFRVGGNTKPGTFTVDILASTDAGRASGSTTFEVSPKGALIPPGEVPVPPVENTTTAPEEPIVIAPENETTTVTPDNSTDISIPVNESSVVIPSNETTIPSPVENETEVIVAPANETEVVTGDNASEVPQIPDEALPINETSVIVEGNETEVAENVTVSEPTLPDLTPQENETSAGNVTDIVVVAPGEEPPANVTAPAEEELPPFENITEVLPPEEENVTAPEAAEENVTVTEPAENITVTEPENVTITEPEQNITVTEPENVTITEPAENVTAPTEENVTAEPELPFLPENETVTEEPTPFPETPNGTTPVEEAPVEEAPTNVTVEAPSQGNVTVETPESNVTVTEPATNATEAPSPSPIPEPENPEQAVEVVENATETLDQAVEGGNVDEIIVAMQQAIQAQQTIVAVVQTATDEERDAAENAVNDLNDLIKEAFNEVSE